MEIDSDYIRSLELHLDACKLDVRDGAMRVKHIKEEIEMHKKELECAQQCLDHSVLVAHRAADTLVEAGGEADVEQE